MLNRVKIQNFKSIGEPGVDLELKPLTFLVGPNGGGKSSILEAIGVVAQNAFSGKLTNFSSWADTIHKPDATAARIGVYRDSLDSSDSELGFLVQIESGGAHTREIAETDLQSKAASWLSLQFRPKTFLISSTRGNVPYAASTGSNPEWVVIHGEFLVPLLAKIFGSREFDSFSIKIEEWADRFGINELKAGFRGNNTTGADYLDSELKTALNLALSSSGSKQILTVITQLFWSPKGSLIMIEEPEISLHPQAQIDVLEMFSEALKEDKQIIATTHSLFMLQGIGYGVIKGWLKPEQVAVYHVEKKKDTGTIAKRLELTDKGAIRGWVPSFTRVERRLLREWLKTLPEE